MCLDVSLLRRDIRDSASHIAIVMGSLSKRSLSYFVDTGSKFLTTYEHGDRPYIRPPCDRIEW